MKTAKIAYMLAFTAAVLFSLSAPLAKLFLDEIQPVFLAAFLYLGSGVGLGILKLAQTNKQRLSAMEANLSMEELPWLLSSILTGGVLAPIVLMFSLVHTPAATASLLLNFEAVATTIIAVFCFKEASDKRIWGSLLLITLASIILTLQFKEDWGISLGALGIILACILWGADNNFTRNISAKDPVIIVVFKGLGAGITSLSLGLLMGYQWPALNTILLVMTLGFFSYGLSIVLFIYALRSLGAARTSALFGTAPFIGVIIALLLLREQPTTSFFLALPFMAAGAFFLLKEEHVHVHKHEPLLHEHIHTHNDPHHNHRHSQGEEQLRHSHWHEHDPLEHNHPHTPDNHHRHLH